jgi:hypothetical protein
MKFNACQRICYTGVSCVFDVGGRHFQGLLQCDAKQINCTGNTFKGWRKVIIRLAVNFLIREKPNTVGISLYEQGLKRLQMMCVHVSHMQNFYYAKVGVTQQQMGFSGLTAIVVSGQTACVV